MVLIYIADGTSNQRRVPSSLRESGTCGSLIWDTESRYSVSGAQKAALALVSGC